MKIISSVFIFLFLATGAQAQYDKEKLTALLVANAWTVKSNVSRPEKKMVFKRDQLVSVDKDSGKGTMNSSREKWSLQSSDGIRWFLNIGAMTYELIVSYAKDGSQYIKLTHEAGKDKVTGYYEINLYATK